MLHLFSVMFHVCEHEPYLTINSMYWISSRLFCLAKDDFFFLCLKLTVRVLHCSKLGMEGSEER